MFYCVGVVHKGDELLEINGVPVVSKTTEQIGHIQNCHTFRVVHKGDELLEINGVPVVSKTTEQIGHIQNCHTFRYHL